MCNFAFGHIFSCSNPRRVSRLCCVLFSSVIRFLINLNFKFTFSKVSRTWRSRSVLSFITWNLIKEKIAWNTDANDEVDDENVENLNSRPVKFMISFPAKNSTLVRESWKLESRRFLHHLFHCQIYALLFLWVKAKFQYHKFIQTQMSRWKDSIWIQYPMIDSGKFKYYMCIRKLCKCHAKREGKTSSRWNKKLCTSLTTFIVSRVAVVDKKCKKKRDGGDDLLLRFLQTRILSISISTFQSFGVVDFSPTSRTTDRWRQWSCWWRKGDKRRENKFIRNVFQIKWSLSLFS